VDDNTFECPNCGAKIYPEMTRCPQCGQNMYPEDEQPPADMDVPSAGWLTSLGAVLIGWMVASGIVLLLNFILAAFISPPSLGNFSKAGLLLAGPVGTLLGSYVAAGIGRPQTGWLGAIVGILTLPILVLLATHWVEVTPAFSLNLWVMLSGGLTIFAGLIGAWLHYKFSQDIAWKEKWRVRGWEDLLYQDLLRKVRFNGSIADRLIEFERKQDPDATRLELIQKAIDRWDRDNR
jgi:hypothetical protein